MDGFITLGVIAVLSAAASARWDLFPHPRPQYRPRHRKDRT